MINKIDNSMVKFPNMYCGECPYWLAYKEPETSDEENREIENICSNCKFNNDSIANTIIEICNIDNNEFADESDIVELF